MPKTARTQGFSPFAKSLCGALLLLLPGCIASEDSLRKEIQALREEVGRVRAQNQSLNARLETLEIAKTPSPTTTTTTTATTAAATTDSDKPALSIVKLEPVAPAQPAAKTDPSDNPAQDRIEAPRPLIRSAAGGNVVAQNLPSTSTPKPEASAPAKGSAQ